MPIANCVSIPYRRLVDLTQQQLSSLKRAREENHSSQNEQQAKRARTPHPKSPWLSYKQLQAINETGAFEPLKTATSQRIETEVVDNFGDECIDRRACIVTDIWVFRRDACRMSIAELPLAAMRRVLGPKAWTTPSIRDYYNCGTIDKRLAGMLLSPRGVEHTENCVQIWMSRDVLRHLRALDAKLILCKSIKDELAPPRIAIADCFVAGTFGEIDAIALIERQAVGLVQTRRIVKVVYGGPGNVLQSRLISWDNRHATIASSVPSVRTCNDFRVVLAGPMAPEQELVVAKQHECNDARVHALQMLLRRINPLNKDIDENFEFDNVAQSRDFFCTRIGKNEDNAGLVARARARQQTVAASSDINSAVVDETSILPTETVIIVTAVDVNEDACLSRALDVIMGHLTYVARRSTSILQHNDPYYLERVYPHLLTFGIGGLSSSRSNRYTKRDVVLHYLNVFSNRIAEDALFKIKCSTTWQRNA
ncbi:hypothetical protein GN958_ATG11153 [Phytophthora infestans]|uniref:Uncharacterized protein n=1 Tax=Phytophthora infestans TaxID=4787 RepID=A0A8S9UMS9_PHYIN|nr:hypothetical protein GN958_ATG11153 [Phytophthora infestans]